MTGIGWMTMMKTNFKILRYATIFTSANNAAVINLYMYIYIYFLWQIFEGKRDVILFCIDCSPSMLALYDDPNYENMKTCKLLTALEAAMQIQKKKVVIGPNDAVGIVLFNTVWNSSLTLFGMTNSRPKLRFSIGRTSHRNKLRSSRMVPMCTNLSIPSMHQRSRN